MLQASCPTLISFLVLLESLLIGFPSETQTETRSFPAQAGDSLVVQNDYGKIRVTGWDSPTIEARITRNWSSQAGKEYTKIAAQKSGNKIFIYCFFSGLGGESADLEVQVPREVNVVIWGANPEIDLRGLHGFVRAQNFTGTITAEDLGASTSLISDVGDIVYKASIQPQGDVRLETSSGSVRCELSGSINARLWLRAGSRITWDKDAEPQFGSVEKQLGSFGPLLYASSLRSAVTVSLFGEHPEAMTPVAAPPQSIPAKAESSPPQAAKEPASNRGAPAQAVPMVGGYSLKVRVDSVFLNVSVRDRSTNRSVPDLGRSDFQVYEDGVPQQIEQLATGDAPFNLLLLLDVSGSTRSFLGLMKQASTDFTRQIKPNDRIAIAAFNSQVELMQDFTNDRTEASRAIGRLNSSGGTAFYDALLTCIDHYMRGIEGRSAIVVFTDGVDNQLEGRNSEGSKTLFSQLYRRIQEIDPIIYTIFLDTERKGGVRQRGVLGEILGGVLGGGRRAGGYPVPSGGSSGNPTIYDEARDQLLTIAEQTGGRMYSPSRIEDLSRIYGEIADDLRIQYQLGYNSTNPLRDGKWREIKVQVPSRPNSVVRTRRGYLALKDKEPARPGDTTP